MKRKRKIKLFMVAISFSCLTLFALAQELRVFESRAEPSKPSKNPQTQMNSKSTEILHKKLYSISGRVINLEYRKGVPYFPLSIVGNGNTREVIADRKGIFKIKDMEPGYYTIHSGREYFLYRPYSFIVTQNNLNNLVFNVRPESPVVSLAPYYQFNFMQEVPSINIKVFRYGRVKFRLYKIEPLKCFSKWASLNDFRRIKPKDEQLIDEWTLDVLYKVPYDIVEKQEQLPMKETGAYLLIANAGGLEFRSIISVTDLIPVVNRHGNKVTVNLALNREKQDTEADILYARASQEGKVINEKRLASPVSFTTCFLKSQPLEILFINGITIHRLLLSYDKS